MQRTRVIKRKKTIKRKLTISMPDTSSDELSPIRKVVKQLFELSPENNTIDLEASKTDSDSDSDYTEPKPWDETLKEPAYKPVVYTARRTEDETLTDYERTFNTQMSTPKGYRNLNIPKSYSWGGRIEPYDVPGRSFKGMMNGWITIYAKENADCMACNRFIEKGEVEFGHLRCHHTIHKNCFRQRQMQIHSKCQLCTGQLNF